MRGVVLAVNLEMIDAPTVEPPAADKPKIGRPSEYRPEFCALVENFGKRGKTFVAFAAEVGVDRATVYRWRDAYPAFRDASSRASALAQSYWEDRLENNVGNREYNARMIEFLLSSRFEDYRPSAQRIELTGANGTPLLGRSLTRDELLKLAAPILDAEIVDQKQIGPAADTAKGD